MSRKLKHKIALGIPLTASEEDELRGNSEANLFAEKMEAVEEFARSLQTEEATTASRSKILSVRQTPPSSRKFATFAIAGAALLILAVPLGVIVGNDLSAKLSPKSGETGNLTSPSPYYHIEIEGLDPKSEDMVPLISWAVMPSSDPTDARSIPKPQEIENQEFRAPSHLEGTFKYEPLISPRQTPASTRALQNRKAVFIGLASLDQMRTYSAKWWILDERVEVFPMGPVMMELNGKMRKLQKWLLNTTHSPNWVTCYGENEFGPLVYTEFRNLRNGKSEIAMTQKVSEITKDELRSLLKVKKL